jgi:hypothetical protein
MFPDKSNKDSESEIWLFKMGGDHLVSAHFRYVSGNHILRDYKNLKNDVIYIIEMTLKKWRSIDLDDLFQE